MEYAEIIMLAAIIALLIAVLGLLRGKSGQSAVLMKDGKINEAALEKTGVSLENLMSRARLAGCFNLGDIDTAVLEENGKISFLPKAGARHLNPCDFNFSPVREGMPEIIVKNGKILEENLKNTEVKKDELMTILFSRGRRLEDILLATVTDSGRIDVFEKN